MNLKKRAQLYPKALPEKLGYDRVKERISTLCDSPLGKREVERVVVYTDAETIGILLQQVQEFKTILSSEEFERPDTGYDDLQKSLDALKINGSVLSHEQLLAIRLFLRQFAQNLRVLRRYRDDFPALNDLSALYPYEKEILVSFEAVFDDQGIIRPEISPELNRIRLEIKKTLRVQDKKFDAILRRCRQEKWLSEEEQTIRNGRRVLAVLSEHKRKIKGIIHDESSTGKTTFLEPQTLVELGNDLFDLRQKERKEIHRIFLELCDEIRPFIEHLEQYQLLAGKFDFVKAKARLAIELNATKPVPSARGILYLEKAYHPLLYLSYKEQQRDVVPLQLEMTQKQRVIIISGPNAGGKSICLKTIGLIQVMYQSGMLVPAGEKAQMPIYNKIFLGMGDDQSLDNDLSTYSSHLKGLKHFANFADKGTLFLLDEFGTGTDPQFGGAIAEAVLDHLVEKKAFGVATTHYTNLKLYAENKAGVENASMMFDQEHMKPTYELQVGRPGSSYALEMAYRIGLNKSIIQYAKDRIGTKVGSFEELVNQLEKEKLVLQRKLTNAQEKENRYRQLSDEYKSLKQELKENKQKMALQYKTQLENELKNYNKRFERTLADLRKSSKSQEEIAKELRKQLRKDTERVSAEVENLKDKVVYGKAETAPLVAGDSVRLIEGTETGILEQIEGKYGIVAFNHLRTKVKLKELIKSEKKAQNKVSKGVNVNNYIMEFNSTLDVRGERADEALKRLEELIDQALILNYSRVKVIHGRGDGILKLKITEFLKHHGSVTTFDFEHPEMGGDGATVIHL